MSKSSRRNRSDEGDAVPRHVPQNRNSSATKRRRNPGNCPVCLAPLRRTADRGRLMRSCASCGATGQPGKRCARCHAEAIWQGPSGAACRSCGLHGQKDDVIAPGTHVHASANGTEFMRLLAARFPEIATSVDECIRGSVYLELGDFARATQQAISAEDVATVRQHFEFVDEILRIGSADLAVPVAQSYLGLLSLDGRHGNRIRARDLLSPRLRMMLSDYEGHCAALRDQP